MLSGRVGVTKRGYCPGAVRAQCALGPAKTVGLLMLVEKEIKGFRVAEIKVVRIELENKLSQNASLNMNYFPDSCIRLL